MDESNLLTLFFVDSQGNENYGLALVSGKYRARIEVKEQKAYLIIFMCINCDSIFSFHYVNSFGKHIEHSPLHPGEESIDYVLLEAWIKFNIPPHYWILASETESGFVVNRYPESEYTKAYTRLKEVLSRSRWAEITKASTFDNLKILDQANLRKGESEALFYPDIPSEIFTPLTL